MHAAIYNNKIFFIYHIKIFCFIMIKKIEEFEMDL
jgi:hypothetical protein